MDSKQGLGASDATANRVYEDFDPHLEWAKDQSFDTLLVYLPGFPKDKLKIQVTSSGKLRIGGERLVVQNKWRRFLKEFPLSPDYDTNKISAKFEGGILYVKVPKLLNTTISPSPNPKIPRPTSTTTDHRHVEDQYQERSKPNLKPDNLFRPSAQSPAHDHDKRATPTTGDQTLGLKPPQKQQEQAPSKPALSLPEKRHAKEPPKNDTKSGISTSSASASSGSGKAEKTVVTSTKLEPEKPAGPGSEGIRKSGEKLASDVGVVKRSTSLVEGYKKVIASGNPRMLVNMLLAVLFIGVLALYAKNILIKSLGKSNGSNHRDHEL